MCLPRFLVSLKKFSLIADCGPLMSNKSDDMITGVRFNWNFLSQTCNNHAFTCPITVDFFPQLRCTHVGRLWTKLSLSSSKTRLAVTIWALIADESWHLWWLLRIIHLEYKVGTCNWLKILQLRRLQPGLLFWFFPGFRVLSPGLL